MFNSTQAYADNVRWQQGDVGMSVLILHAAHYFMKVPVMAYLAGDNDYKKKHR